MKNIIFSGACTALITPFCSGRIDYENFAKIIENQIASGIDALLICGTTGECATLSDIEKRDIFTFAANKIQKRVKMIAGTGSNDTKKAGELSKFAGDIGADAVLVVTPYYNKTSQEGLLKHYFTIADGIDIPMIVYNVPTRTGIDIKPDTYKKLSEHENIVGIKESKNNISDIAMTVKNCPGVCLYSGNDDMTYPLLALGARGVISVMSNIFPYEISEMCRKYIYAEDENDKNKALEIFLKTFDLSRELFCDVNPIPVKTLMAYEGMCHEEFRLPLVNISEKNRKKLIECYNLTAEKLKKI